jgi:ATP-dependent DNA helicase RecG
METAELIEIVSRGEDSRHQFKLNMTNAAQLAAEMVAFSNSGGGKILIGVGDYQVVHGLAAADIHRLNQLVSNAASQNVRPAINPISENVSHPNGTVMVVTIPDGVAKPYMDHGGVIWVKTGADKRPASSREEIQRMFQQSSLVHADEIPVTGTGVGDVDLPYFEAFFDQQPFDAPLAKQPIPLPQLLTNMNLMRAESLNLAAVLLFSRTPQYRLPAFIAKAIAYPGVEPDDAAYLDSRDIVGKLADVFQQTLGFLIANTGTRQGDRGVNSTGEPEIPRIVWEELIANALVHRDYFVTAPIRIFVFADRVEIVSPGHLPNNLTVENILKGNSNIRNPVLASFAAKLLPYRRLGNGILRARKAYAGIEFRDDREANLFKVTVARPRRG